MRRFPLHALRACTCAVLLVGCQATVAPIVLPAPPPTPPVSVEISGPSRIDAKGPYRWEAFAFGGSGGFRYSWVVMRQAGQSMATTEQGVSLLVTGADGDMMLTLTVTSGDQANIQSFRVRNCIGGCDTLQ